MIETPPESRALGVDLDISEGYKKVFACTLWKRIFCLEFGKGDGYDWDDLD